MSNRTFRALVIEDDPDIRDLHVFLLESKYQAEVVTADFGQMAIKILSADTAFDCIICDYRMHPGNGGEVFLFLESRGLKIPYILCSADDPANLPEFQGKKVAYAAKPSFKDAIVQFVGPLIRQNREIAEDSPANASCEKFCRVSVASLQKINSLPCDVYLRLSEVKYIKVFKKGDPFSIEDLKKSQTKGIDYLFVNKENANDVFDQLSKNIAFVALARDSKPSDIVQLNESVIETFRTLGSEIGFSPEVIGVARSAVEATLGVVEKTPGLKALLKDLLIQDSNFISSHSIALGFISSAIAKAMEWTTDSTLYKLTLAGFLHDITVKNQEIAKIQSEAELKDRISKGAKFSEEDIRSFWEHPKDAADIARKFNAVPPDVDVIVLQHHENVRGTGFPNKLNHTKISPLSSAFIISHDILNHRTSTNGNFDIKEFLRVNASVYEFGHFKKIAQMLAVTSIFSD